MTIERNCLSEPNKNSSRVAEEDTLDDWMATHPNQPRVPGDPRYPEYMEKQQRAYIHGIVEAYRLDIEVIEQAQNESMPDLVLRGKYCSCSRKCELKFNHSRWEYRHGEPETEGSYEHLLLRGIDSFIKTRHTILPEDNQLPTLETPLLFEGDPWDMDGTHRQFASDLVRFVHRQSNHWIIGCRRGTENQAVGTPTVMEVSYSAHTMSTPRSTNRVSSSQDQQRDHRRRTNPDQDSSPDQPRESIDQWDPLRFLRNLYRQSMLTTTTFRVITNRIFSPYFILERTEL